jgi:hypothetical protein
MRAEIAGVMAHELSHVVLRHGTAQATKATKYEIGAVAGQILGAIVGGAAGSIIAQGSNFGISTYFMKFSREYESQADILGSQIMARAGYNPVDMANMFHTLAAQGGSGPEWLSDHPEPGQPRAAHSAGSAGTALHRGRLPEHRRVQLDSEPPEGDVARAHRAADCQPAEDRPASRHGRTRGSTSSPPLAASARISQPTRCV